LSCYLDEIIFRVVVDKLNTGMDTADTFDAATLYFRQQYYKFDKRWMS